MYSFIYPKVSRLVVNNMCMLLSIGFIMITRLNYDKAAKQYLIAAAGIVLCLVIPIIIRKARFLSEWRILYGIIGIVSLAVVVVVWCNAWLYGCRNQHPAIRTCEDCLCVLRGIEF